MVANRLRYVPNANANGPDSFTYRANDGAGPGPAATVTVSISAVNDVPTCANVTLTTNEDVMGERDPSCSDADGEALTYTIGTTPVPTKGTATEADSSAT